MSYSTIHRNANDTAFQNRVTAACAQENVEGDPANAAYLMRWDIATESDVEAAYASAIAAENPDPGGDESVITDQMILSKVQAFLPAGAATSSSRTKAKAKS